MYMAMPFVSLNGANTHRIQRQNETAIGQDYDSCVRLNELVATALHSIPRLIARQMAF